MSEPMTKERRADLKADCVGDWGGLSPDAGNEALDEIERLERELDEAREALVWALYGHERPAPAEFQPAIDAARAAKEENNETPA